MDTRTREAIRKMLQDHLRETDTPEKARAWLISTGIYDEWGKLSLPYGGDKDEGALDMKRFTVGKPCGEWTVWDSTKTVCVARCPSELWANRIAKALNASVKK